MKYLKPLKLYEIYFLNKNTIPACYGLLGLDVNENHLTLACSEPRLAWAEPLWPSLSKSESIDFIAYRLKTRMADNGLEGIVAGFSCIENKGKPDIGEAKTLIDSLRQTGYFKGMKYTYWDRKLMGKSRERRMTTLLRRKDLPHDMPETEVEKRIERVREIHIPNIRACLLLQGFLEYGAMCSGDAFDIEARKSELDT